MMRDSGTNLSKHERKTQNTGEVSFQMRGEEMSHQFINVEKKGHITILTMNRPEVLNAIHPMISREMSRAIDEFDEDAEQWVMIVTGAGDRAFSAGNDLKFTAANGAARVKELMAGLKGGFGGITNRHDCSKPFIAAVNGFAFGGGFEIALACDIIIAAENALFSFPEPRVGLMAAAGGVHRLPRRIPYHLAMEMLLTSNRVGAEQGREYGFVNKVAPSEQLMSTAEAYAGEIMKGAPLSIRASKEATNAGMDYSLTEVITRVFPIHKAMQESEDTVEGPKAFAEKRPPRWKGR
jgi:crotonobetainyl-CoA hydratase